MSPQKESRKKEFWKIPVSAGMEREDLLHSYLYAERFLAVSSTSLSLSIVASISTWRFRIEKKFETAQASKAWSVQ